MTVDCRIYRCRKQEEMYLYVRSDIGPDELPEALLRQVGTLTEVMPLSLTAESRLARADVTRVLEKLEAEGYYLQLPPRGLINPRLHFGD